ncbi:MAG: quinohemoprotein amine dehydrogenase subunit alpha [Acidobacteria bacterium]|nr:MAG: quinohemoprotein amine dehydrogenase subunit alpha [Acidobacteriota bacterium]PYS14751.1 MAG: quinohemoprotein amine dehydrogenase subunit alpha [Acidobacteriota bacterium]
MMTKVAGLAVLAVLLLVQSAQAQAPGSPPAAVPAAQEKPEEGIPVTDPLVIAKCGTCHTRDDKGNLSRISWERAAPEGWEEAIKRMVRLNGLEITPAEARSVLKYLSTYHGLAPEEAKPVMYMAEHRIQDEPVPNEAVRTTCMGCHPFGRGLSWRRSKEDWKLLTNMHVFLYAQADVAFRRGFFGTGNAPLIAQVAEDAPPLVDQTLDYLAQNAPLHTPDWAAWRARMRAPKLDGRWLVSAHIAGRGKYYGEMVMERGSAEDEFRTRVKLQSVTDGSTLARSGQGLVYAGYSWRGRSNATNPAGAAPNDLSKEMRETMWISPDQLWAEGRWFWGEYQEFGVDVKLVRASAEPTLLGVDRTMLKLGSQANRIRVLGDNLPSQISAADLDFGSGITLRRIVSQTLGEIVAEVDVASNAVPGKRDIALRRSVLQSVIAVYDRVDYIKVVPEASIAHLGSDVHPKGYEQFEAIAYQGGADGKLHTADDVELGPVDVTWSVEEYLSVYGDDDKDFVGTLNPMGLFTPALDGPNPKRKFGRNNYGDVWVVATAKNEKDKDDKPLTGRSYLVVTVPTYIRWDQPEVSK